MRLCLCLILHQKRCLFRRVLLSKFILSFLLTDRRIKVFSGKYPFALWGAYTEPVQPYLIEPKLTALLLENEQRKETMNPIERIARFHLEFEGIHPFIDGNGRTGRLILNLDLIRNGYPPVNVKFTDRKKYYDAFDEYYKNGSAEKNDRTCSRLCK